MANQAEQGFFSPFLQRARITAALPYLKGRVLDIGCGNGALAAHVSPAAYLGVDRDAAALDAARRAFARHQFVSELPEAGAFDTITALALIEHLPEPRREVVRWSALLSGGGHIVITTPHKSFGIVHELGSRLGLFSRAAADEHEEMFDRRTLMHLAEQCGLRIERYARFLCGANQLALLASNRSAGS
jgi:2-polyprenyl-3-methyl-5-hydroxy-6-metoxy-1,4-benzoquinol methylase